jgi:outer membrane protein TolC
VPFLFPSRWFDLDASKKTYFAEVQGLEATTLNTYAIAYSLLLQVAGEQEIYNAMLERQANLRQYIAFLEAQYGLGLIPQADLLRGQIDLGRAQNDLSKTSEMISGERAALRKMLGFDINQEFTIETHAVNESILEAKTLERSLDLVLKRAPERAQLDLAAEAARANVKSAQWAFLAGCSGGSGSVGNSSSPGFSANSTFTVDFGFGYFPRVELARRNVQDAEVRKVDLMLEIGRNLETTLSSIHETRARIVTLEGELLLAQRLLSEQTELVQLGRAGVKEVLDAHTAIASTQMELITSRLQLSVHRVTIKRMAIEDRFLPVLISSRVRLETL